jgi:hypothetical protein
MYAKVGKCCFAMSQYLHCQLKNTIKIINTCKQQQQQTEQAHPQTL